MVTRHAEGLNLAVDEAAYASARRKMQDYLRHLQDLQLTHKDCLNCRARLSHDRQSLESVQLDVDEVQGEINSLAGQQERLALQLEQVLHRLEELGAERIRQDSCHGEPPRRCRKRSSGLLKRWKGLSTRLGGGERWQPTARNWLALVRSQTYGSGFFRRMCGW